MKKLESANTNVSAVFRDNVWNLIMFVYLATGLGLAPLVIGEILVAIGLLEAMNEQTMPSWVYGYVVLTTYTAGFALMVAWLPALLICIIFWNRWRAVVPAGAVIVFAVSLFLLPDSSVNSTLLNIAAVTYVLVASGVGIEWLVQRKFGIG